MKKVLLLLIIFTLSCTFGWAQLGVGQQMQNNSFENWYNETSARIAPTGWHSLNSGTGSLISIATADFISRQNAQPGGTGSYCVRVTCKTVLFVAANGSLTSGCFNAGSTTPSDPANCTYTSTNSGYQQVLTAYPDSVYLWVRTSIKNNKNARVHIIIHNDVVAGNNAICQDPNPGSQGSSSTGGIVNTDWATNEGKIVAEAEWNNHVANWTQIKLPFVYKNNGSTPSYILATLASNQAAGEGKAGDYLEFDDVVLIYNTRLATLKKSGTNTNISGFDPDITTYEYPLCPGASFPEFTFSCQSNHATASITHSPSTNEPYTTIKVTHQNQDDVYKVYTINFTTASVPDAPIVTAPDADCAPAAHPITITATSETATGYRWYNSATSTNAIGEANATSFSVQGVIGSITYYVSAVNAAGCESDDRTPVTVTTKPLPTAPTAGNTTPVCVGETGTFTATIPEDNDLICRWYADNNSSDILGTGTSLEVSNLTQNTTRYASTYNTSTGCESGRVAVTVNVKSIPNAPTLSGDSHCGPGDVTLNVLNALNDVTYTWYNANNAPVDTGSSYTATGLDNTAVYHVTATANGCTGASATVTATINPIPGAPEISGNEAICDGNTLTLTATPGSNADEIKWYNNNEQQVSENADFTTPVLNDNTSYTAKSYNSTTGCYSAATEVNVVVNDIPGAPSLTGNSHCGTGDVTLNVSNALNDITYTWYNDNSTQVGTGSSFTAENLSSTATYHVTATANGCTGASASVTATINPVPAMPDVTDGANCGTREVSLSATVGENGDQLQWFTAAEGGEAFSTATNFTTDEISETTYYYVASYNTTTQCVSARQQVVATINPIPGAPEISGNEAICDGNTLTLTATPGSNANEIRWYNSSDGQVGTSTSFTTPVLNDNTSYTAKSYNSTTGCYSLATAAAIVVNDIPAAPELSSNSRCGTGDVTLNVLNALNDVTYTWYNANDEQLGTGSSYTAENLASTTNYYVTATANGCTGASATVTATIHSIPALPAVTAGAHCGAGEVSLSATAGENGNQVRWFANEEGGEPIGTENDFTTPSINTTTTYYVASYNSNTQCFGARTAVVATINNIPAAPTAEDVILCGPGVATLTAVPAEGLNCQWFNANHAEITNGVSADSTTLTTGNLSNNNTYYVCAFDPNTNCHSDTITVQVTVAAVPGIPSASNVARCGAGTVTLTATPNNANSCRWYNAESELVYEGTSFEIANLEETTTFTCKSYNSETGCESNYTRTVTATINPIPDVPTVNGNNPICGSGAIQMTGVPGTNATVCRWINGNDTTTNNSFSTGNISQSTDYLVQSYNANTRCASENTTVSVVVNTLPVAPQTTNDTQCLGTEVTLTASSAEENIAFRWYATAQDNTILAEASEFHPTNLTVGENNFYAAAYDTLTGCTSAERILATATAIAAPAIPNVADTAHCGPAAFTLNIIDPQPNTTYKWYTEAQGGTATEGTSFTTGTLTATTHYYVSAAVSGYDCESGRREVTVTINTIPDNLAINGNVAICEGQNLTVSASADNATDYVWSDGQNESEGVNFTTPTLLDNANYTVKAYNANTHCESEVVNFTVTVNPNPGIPKVGSDTQCEHNTITLTAFAATGCTSYWYTSQESTESFANGDSYSTSTLPVGTTTYYVSQRDDITHCESERVAVEAIVNPTYAVNYPVVACDSFRWNNELFTESGNYERTLHTQHNCDSVVTLQLTINRSKVTNIDTTVCDAFVWNGQTYETSGDYQQSFQTTQQCDSTVNVHLIVKKSTVGSDHIYLCSNELPYNYNNLYTVIEAGTFTIHTENIAGCDSTITLTVTVNTQPAVAINLAPADRCGEGTVKLSAHAGTNGTTCRWYANETSTEVLFAGTEYTTGNLTESTTLYVTSYNDYNGHPCESGRQAIVATVNPVPAEPTVSDQVRCGDGNVEFAATIDENATTCRWYLTANTTNVAADGLSYNPNLSVNMGNTSFYVESYNNTTECKSSRKEVKAQAFAIPAVPVLTAMSHCGPQQFSIDAPANGYYKWYDSEGSTETLDINNNTTPTVDASRSYFISHAVDYAGISCESNKSELALTIYPVYEAQDLYDTLCQGETYTQHGLNETFNDAGAFDRVINTVSSTNCDSLVTLHLWVKEIRYFEFEETVCDSYIWNNETFTASENITRHFISSIGCDSVVTLHLTVNKSVQNEFSDIACNEYQWNNETYTTSGNYVQHFSTVNGCDSMVTLHLTINYSAQTEFSDIACDSYQWNNETYTQSGDYVQHFNTSKGCDSTVTLHLTVNYSNAANLNDAVCAGTRYTANGFDTLFNTAGNYTLVRHDLNQAGCDSTTTLILKVNPIYNQNVTLTICETALPYTWNDITYPVGTASGDYDHTYSTHTAAGCDSIVTLHLTISNQYITPLAADICEGETYPFAGQVLNQSGIYYDTLLATNHCDSIIRLSLTVHELHTTNLNASICLGETYTENGFNETPETVGTFNYQQIVQTSFGCDSTINLALTVNPVYHFTEYDTVCANELPIVWQGLQIDQEGSYTAEYQTINTCDSTITLYLTVNPVYNQTENAVICANELPYTWRDTVFAVGTTSGEYVFNRSTVNGCDSIVTLTLTVNSIYDQTESETICQNELPYTWRDTVFGTETTSGEYVFNKSTVNGCDSTVTLTLTVNPSYTQSENATICQNELPYSWRDTVFAAGTTSGEYVFNRSTVNGCDSTVILNLTVNPSYNLEANLTICQNELPYTWRDTVFGTETIGGDYVFSKSSVNGCDSIVTLHLTVNPAKHTDLYEEICEGDVYIYNNRPYEDQNDYNFTFQTALGCDSTVTLHLTVNPIYNIDTTINICEGLLPYTFADTVFNGSGRKDIYLHTQNGCDSIYHVTLNVRPFITSTRTATICDNELPYHIEDSIFYQAGTYEVTVSHNDGCNEIITLTLNVNPTYNDTLTTTVCDRFVWNNEVYTESGIYTQQFSTTKGCDSIVTYNLTVNYSKDTLLTPVICQGESYVENGFNQNPENAGIVYDTLHLQCVGTGCDSTVYLELTVNPSYNLTENEVICANELPYTWRDTVFAVETVSGEYVFNRSTVNGCDSTVTLTLAVNPVYNQTENEVICASELPYTWRDTVFAVGTTSGEYVFNRSTVDGCDSTVMLTLTVNPVYNQTENEVICASELPYTWRDTVFAEGTTSGEFVFNRSTVNGCDSTVTLTLTVNPVYDQTENEVICANELPYTWRDTIFAVGTTSGEYIFNRSSVNGCDSTVTLTLTVNPTYNQTESETICQNELPYTWRDTVFAVGTTSGDYVFNRNTVNGCDSTVTLTLTVNPSYTQSENETICQVELPYTWRDTVFAEGTVSGDYIFHRSTINGCDSIVTLHLTVNPNNEYYDVPVSFCEGGSYTWNNQVITESGLYTDTVDNEYGCYDVYKLVVTVNPVYSFTEYDTVCSSELPITWKGKTINQAGTTPAEYHTINGCDSIYYLVLTVNTSYNQSESEIICQNDLPYTWRDTNFLAGTVSGDYTFYRNTINGCDSIVTLHLTVNPSYEQSETVTICQNDLPYTWRDTIFTEGTVSGDYIFSKNTVNGCDSIVTLHLTVNQSYTQSETETICQNELPFTWRDTIFTEGTVSGDYVFSKNTVNGCDSIVTLHLTVNPKFNLSETETICQNELPYTWRDTNFLAGTVSGDYIFHRNTINGCDSIVTLHLTVNQNYNLEASQIICQNDLPYVWRDTNFLQGTVSGDYVFHRNTVNGCDSTVTLHLTVNQSYTQEESLSICQQELPYTWRDTNFLAGTISGDYIFHRNTILGCDSIVTLHLTVNPTKYSVENASACSNEEVYNWHGHDITATGVYYDTLNTSLDCDSVCELRFTLLDPSVAIFADTICANTPYQGYGFEFTPALSGDTTLVRVTENVAGCDSTITVNLYVKPMATLTFDTIYCGPFQWNNQWYLESGTYQQSFPAANGCDSIVTMNLIIDTHSYDTIEVVACESYEWEGTVYDHSGMFTKVYPQTVGCDSIATMILTINHATEVTLYDTTCQGHRYQEYGFDTLTINVGTFNLQRVDDNAAGCDSIINLVLTVHRGYAFVDSASTCSNDEFVWHGIHCDTTGWYIKNYETIHGCDSAYMLHLTINPSYEQDVTDTAIVGVYYSNYGFDYTPQSPGIMNIDIPEVTVDGCDSILHFTLIIIDGDGINLHYLDQHITLYPNPTNNVFTVSSTVDMIRELTIYDNNGRAVLRQSINDFNGQVNVDNLTPGIYFVQMMTSDHIVTKKLIIQH